VGHELQQDSQARPVQTLSPVACRDGEGSEAPLGSICQIPHESSAAAPYAGTRKSQVIRQRATQEMGEGRRASGVTGHEGHVPA
jgi:hypothetical protein